MLPAKNLELINAEEVEQKVWLALRKALWPEEEEESLKTEIVDFIHEGEKTLALVGQYDNSYVCLIEARIKANSKILNQPHIFIDAWYVVESYRRNGFGLKMIKEMESWARKNSLEILVSDTTLDYPNSPSVHIACGFQQLDEKLIFAKRLV